MTPARLARRGAYHVGNVRAQLLAAARDILAESGRGALSLRAIAERAGVAPGTVYYHYVDKAALLAGLAVDGFRQLAEAMRLAYAADSSAGGGLRSTGAAYLNFLREKPELYELMYEARDTGRADVVAAEAEAIAVSRGAIMSDFEGLYPEDLAYDMAEAIWAWGRGIAAVGLARGADGSDRGDEAVQAAVRGLTALIARA